ncbi:MAG: hypothetical protein AAF443_00520 [Chlamydiota bacterium]
MTKSACYAAFFISTSFLWGQTIEEKVNQCREEKWGDEREDSCQALNHRLFKLRGQLQEKYQLVEGYYQRNEKEEVFQQLLKEVNQLRAEITALEVKWRAVTVAEAKEEGEGHSLWDEEETTLSQLIMEYGSQDYLYVIPPEILSKKIYLHSGIPIPRESWAELLEIILIQNEVGVKQLNPFARKLYLLKNGLASVDQILTTPDDLALVSNQTRIAYIFSPPPERIKGIAHFFDRFRDQKNSFIYQVGYKIAIVASKEEVQKLLTLHDAIWKKENGKVAEIISMSRLAPKEMEKILKAYFEGVKQKARFGRNKTQADELIFIPLKDQGSLVLIGPKNMVAQAKEIARKAESQIEDPLEMTVFWYTCRHSDPVDVAEALEKVYAALIYSGVEGEQPKPQTAPLPPLRSQRPDKSFPINPPEYGPPPYSPVTQPPSVLSPTLEEQKRRSYTTNFVPYPKTGSIMMVVRRDTLAKIKDLLRKIDVPKKMVRIEVLFFEKRIENENQFGLNMFNWGASASNQRRSGASYTQPSGIIEFFIQRTSNSFWGTFDIAYNFLLKQTNIRINAAPSTVTLNQTPAQISIEQEVSINNGAVPVTTTSSTTIPEPSFSRAQYGITLVVTPTVHDPTMEEESRYSVTLETDIKFDTFDAASIESSNYRPNVMRRQVKNFVRVADGETVILGGLRRKDAQDSNNKLPFLGEIPGIGKLFGNSKMTDNETEMFIFMTPKIIFDIDENLEQARCEQLIKRPGDLPEFLERIEEGKRMYKRRLFDNSLKLIFGNIHD